jgi:hypothetical protein
MNISINRAGQFCLRAKAAEMKHYTALIKLQLNRGFFNTKLANRENSSAGGMSFAES